MDLQEEIRLVKSLAEVMEAKLMQNQHKGGWEREMPDYLTRRAASELYELEEAIDDIRANGPSHERVNAVWAEAADVANFAMMAAHVATNYDDEEL